MQRSLFHIASTIRRSTPASSWFASPLSAAASPVVARRNFTTLLSSLTASSRLPLNSAPPQHGLDQQQQREQHRQQLQQTRQRSSRSRRGLYDGKDVRFGNNVPFSMKKTRRRWNPNVQFKRIYSEILDEMIPFHVTTSALRSIDKYGGLDEYLLRSPMVSTKGEGEGQRVRNRIVQKMKHREELKKQALARGESIEDWDKIALVGKKMKGSAATATTTMPTTTAATAESSAIGIVGAS